ncbi:hypothetical protein O181_082762 [Austropuccinia psidii MF-1]|uniref:Uncharacterized protein n=1 Tax=Austropuccinia psidii MF-1 TaxID=1389203 RepID=A0A9Q3FT64_9BASI|nr:hypothetical protein [Austropuccinia psidii MF-1]
MARQENIETTSTATIVLFLSTLQKAKNLANDQKQAITPKEAPKKGYRCDYDRRQSVTQGQGSVNEAQTDILCHSEADDTSLPSERAGTITRTLSGPLKSQDKGLQQCLAAKRLPDPCSSVEKLQELLPDCEKISGPSQYLLAQP